MIFFTKNKTIHWIRFIFNPRLRYFLFPVILGLGVFSVVYPWGNRESQTPPIDPSAVPGTYQFRIETDQSSPIILTLELALDRRVTLTEDFGGDRTYVQEGFWSFDGRELVTRVLTKEGTEPPGPWEPRPPRILRWIARVPEQSPVDQNSRDPIGVSDPFYPLDYLLSDQVLEDLPSPDIRLEKVKGPQVLGVIWEWIRTLTPKETFESPAPESHTLFMDYNGALGLQIGCNRGGGEVTLLPENPSHPVSGSIELGSIFSTMMYCPDQETADRFSRELQYARIYFLKDQLLHLDLLADGGTMVFRPRIAGIAEAELD